MKKIMSSCNHRGYNTKIKIFNEDIIEFSYYGAPMNVGKQTVSLISEEKQINKWTDVNAVLVLHFQKGICIHQQTSYTAMLWRIKNYGIHL